MKLHLWGPEANEAELVFEVHASSVATDLSLLELSFKESSDLDGVLLVLLLYLVLDGPGNSSEYRHGLLIPWLLVHDPLLSKNPHVNKPWVAIFAIGKAHHLHFVKFGKRGHLANLFLKTVGLVQVLLETFSGHLLHVNATADSSLGSLDGTQNTSTVDCVAPHSKNNF